jgi:hypothetical protein
MRALLFVLAALGTTAAPACGFHDGGGVDRGMLNFIYPGALSVGTRTWMAQREGLIPADASVEETAQARNVFGLLRATAALRQWKAHLEGAREPREAAPLAVVLLGPMLWSRYEFSGNGIALSAHVDGPLAGDVVMVTEVAVLGALASEQFTLREAREMGLVAFYGDVNNSWRSR